MKFTLVPSLERAALASISATLWKIWWIPHNKKDRPSHVAGESETTARVLHYPPLIDWVKARNKVKESVQKLIIPEELKVKVSVFTDAIGGQIESWLQSHVDRWRIVYKVPETFVWTSFGTIDLQKTANLMVCDDAIDIVSRFRLASIYCLEEHMLPLLNQIGEKRKHNIINLGSHRDGLTHFISDIGDYFWAKQRQQRGIVYHTDEGHPPDRSPIELFEKSLEKYGFCVAAKFFYLESLEKQNNESILPIINRALTRFNGRSLYCDLQDAKTVCFFLNLLNEDQQIQVLRRAPRVVLSVFLKWPWHELFVKVDQLVGYVLSEVDFHFVLNEIIEEKMLSCQHDDYEQIFIYVWQKASGECKNFVYETNYDVADYFQKLCEHENWYACNLLLQGVPEHKRGEMFFHWLVYVTDYFTSLTNKGKWGKIECFLTTCHLSNQEMVEFRDRIIKHLHLPHDSEEKVKTFNNIVNAFISANKQMR